MRLKLGLLTTAVAFGLGTAVALAEDAPGAKSDITIAADKNANDISKGAANESGGASDESSGNMPGANADSDTPSESQGSLPPEKDKM
jgi:hypothetical protein